MILKIFCIKLIILKYYMSRWYRNSWQLGRRRAGQLRFEFVAVLVGQIVYIFINKFFFLRYEIAFFLQKCIMDQTFPVVHKSRRPQARLLDSHTVLHTLWLEPSISWIASHFYRWTPCIFNRVGMQYHEGLAFGFGFTLVQNNKLQKWLLYSPILFNLTMIIQP
jgi:hypothetical protein